MSSAPVLQHARSGVDTIDAIYDRRAVRSYRPDAVGEETIRTLLDAAIHAPSAVNAQPWAFAVVQDTKLLQRISDRAKKLSLERIRPGTRLWEHRAMLEDPGFNVFYDARTLIVVCAAPGDWPPNEDCCFAAQNLMLAAHALGLATCPIGFARDALNEPDWKRELAIPSDHSVVIPIIVGHAREQPPPTPRKDARILSWR